MYPFVEAYVQKMNPGATPKVVGALLDMNALEDQIQVRRGRTVALLPMKSMSVRSHV